jgi:deoxyribodipyrimidine photo-lyase
MSERCRQRWAVIMMNLAIPSSRVARANQAAQRPDGAYVLYWMTSARRTQDNFGLQHALDRAQALGRPLLVLEALRCDYRWASARFHRFILDGMAENRRALRGPGLRHYAYVEPSPGQGRGLLEALAANACLVVTDHFPCFFLPRMVAAASRRLPVSVEAVDSNGVMPLSEAPKVFTTAHSFRRHLHKNILSHLLEMPLERPLSLARLTGEVPLPSSLCERWPEASEALLDGSNTFEFDALPVDHRVDAVGPGGGPSRGLERAMDFVERRLGAYPEARNQPESQGGSGLSPYLHFGHVSTHSVMRMILEVEGWTPERVAPKPTGSRAGWWGMSEAAESFIDELVTWREVGYTFCHLRPDDYDSYDSLPQWALDTLEIHGDDPREFIYDREALEGANTHDELWNAAQRQLVVEGRIHGYLRMLWGKKILEWSEHPRVALEHLIELNNKYALDGRNPNSYSGLLWTLGRFDRAWGPERPIFGKVRYMSSVNTARKVRVKEYLKRWAYPQSGRLFP